MLGATAFRSLAVTEIAKAPTGVPAVVDTVNVDAPELAPLIAMLEGLNEQAGAGVPPEIAVHASVTRPAYPFAGVTRIVDVECPPAAIEPGSSGDAVSM